MARTTPPQSFWHRLCCRHTSSTRSPPASAAAQPTPLTDCIALSLIRHSHMLQSSLPTHFVYSAGVEDGVEDAFIFCPSTTGRLTKQLRTIVSIKDVEATNAFLMPRILSGDLAGLDCYDRDGFYPAYSSRHYKPVIDKFHRLEEELTDVKTRGHNYDLLSVTHTAVDRQLTAILAYMAGKLVYNSCKNHSERHGLIIVGPRGSGKSATLKRFALCASVAYPTIRAVYISFRSVNVPIHPLYNKTLVDYLSALLFGCVFAATDTRTSLVLFLERLRTEGLHLVVMLDELESLFHSYTPHTMCIRAEIEAFASDPRGTVLTVCCSSTTILHQLVRATLPEPLHSIYQLAPHSRDMNGTKFAEIRLAVASPTDTTKDLLSPFFSAQACADAGMRRLIVAALGTSPRALHRGRPERFHPIRCFSMLEETAYLAEAYPSINLLIHLLYDLLIRKNKELMDMACPIMMGEVTVQWHVFRDTPWDEAGHPLAFNALNDSDIALIWRAFSLILGEELVDDMKGAFVDYLFDSGVIVLQQVRVAPQVFNVYPQSLYAMCLHKNFAHHQRYGPADLQLALSRVNAGAGSLAIRLAIDPQSYSRLAQVGLELASTAAAGEL